MPNIKVYSSEVSRMELEYFLRLLFLLFIISMIIIGIILTVKVKSPKKKICCFLLVLFAVFNLSITLYSGKIHNKYTIKEETLAQAVDIIIENLPKNEEILYSTFYTFSFSTEEYKGVIEVEKKHKINHVENSTFFGNNVKVVQIDDSITYVEDDYLLTRDNFLALSTEGYGVTKVVNEQYDIWITFSFEYNPIFDFMYWTIGSPTLFAKTKTVDVLEIANHLQKGEIIKDMS